MGPPAKSVAPPPTPPNRGRCLLCRRPALPPVELKKATGKLKGCAVSLCTIFGLPDNHPFKVIYERAQYCGACLKEMEEADVTLGKLELMKQSLLRFQNRVYSKLGDNYFQIGDRDKLKASYVDFEGGEGALKGKKFSYDDIVKVVYEKLDKDCLKWERFSSEGNIDAGLTLSSSPSKVEASTQTEGALEGPCKASPKKKVAEVVTIGEDDNGGNDTSHQPGFPDVGDDWDGDDDTGGGGGGGEDDGAGSDFGTTISSSIFEDPLNNYEKSSSKVEIDYGPQAVGLPFAKAPINFDHKIFCTFDPENCKRFFYDEYNLKVHIRSFHEGNPRPHECTVCMKTFIDEGRLKSHFLRVHVTSESFMCDQCGKGFASPQILRDHVRKKHDNASSEDTHTCAFCSAPFSSPLDKTNHEELHRAKEFPFACVFCTEVFPNSMNLRAHFNTTHAESKVTCEICGKVLGSEISLKNHMNVHTQAFVCDQCGFAGSSKHSLRNHMMTHSTEKRFTCQDCGRAFKYQKNLTSHMRVHSGEKPYICQLCGASFREQSYLRRHEESHSTQNNYSCEECGMGFKVKENLKKHMRTHKEGYVPKRKPYKPRSEEQKMARRIKAELKREQGLLGPAPRRRSPKKPEGTEAIPYRRSVGVSGSRTIKAEPKTRKKKRGSPSRKRRKVEKRGRKKRKYSSSEEEEEEEVDPSEEDLEEEEEEDLTYLDIGKKEEDEVNSAVASIQQTPQHTTMYSQSTEIMYTTDFATQQVNSQGVGQATFIPVTVVNPQGGRTASQIVVRQRAQQQQQAQQVTHNYQLF